MSEPETMSGKLKALITHGAESIVAIVLVLCFFLLFLGILGLSFPKGTNLADLMNHRALDERPRGSKFDVGIGTVQDIRQGRSFTALLTHVFRSVKDKPSNSITWHDARAGVPLKNRHAVQSFTGSAATIAFDQSNYLNLGENSLIVIRALEEDRDTRRRKASVVMLDGELFGKLSDEPDQPMAVEVVTAGSTINVNSSGESAADFKVQINDDKSSTVSVFEGRAEIVADGRTHVVGANFSITVDEFGVTGELMRLPAAPLPAFPAASVALTYRSLPPPVSFTWLDDGETEMYRLTLARDKEFSKVVYRKDTANSGLVFGKLEEGRYYWRVSGLTGNVEGPSSSPRVVKLERDIDAPKLEVDFPGGAIGTERFVLNGVTEPGADVFIGSDQANVTNSGEFELALQLRRGLNVVVVEAIDAAGNITYQSQLVNGKF